MKLNGQVGSYNPDDLFYDTSFPVQTGAVTLEAGQGILNRGTILGKNLEGKHIVASLTAEPKIEADVILTDDIDTGDETATVDVKAEVYTSGSFNVGALYTDGTDKVLDHYDTLRGKGIYLKQSI